MTYWNEVGDSHIRFWSTPAYRGYYRTRSKITDQGYRCDTLQSSDVVYLGTCDLMTSIEEDNARWAELLHKEKYSDKPLICLGTVASGLPTMVRRLYAYIENFGAPKELYMTVPRFDGYEYVNKSGKCYNVSSRKGSAYFCYDTGLIERNELDTWLLQLESNKQLRNPFNNQYMLEERFAFIEMICKAHNIKLQWTFNLSDASVVVLYHNISSFEHISEFMKSSFTGLALLEDHVSDRAIGEKTHSNIYEKFKSPGGWDYTKLCEVSEINNNWLINKYGTKVIKYEDQ